MKKTIITLYLIVFTFVNSHSQFYGGGGSICLDCHASIEVGSVLSTISGLDNSSEKFGFHIGYYQFKYVSESFTFRYGLSYSNLGAKFDDPDNLLEYNKLIIHSINIPLSVHYTYKNQFQAFAGGELGTNFFGKLPVSNNPMAFQTDFNERIKLFDGSVFIGAGYILADTIDFNIKYNFGLTNISQDNDNNWRENWFTLSIAYTFRDKLD